jgi:microcystin degradation protein MlrC
LDAIFNKRTEASLRSSRKRLAVARFWYEGNAFSPLDADLAAFERCEWASGDGALAAARGTATEIGAAAAFADTHPEWEVVALRCASALPAGPVDDTVFDQITRELTDGFVAGCASGGWDAVYLSLHGAAITRTRQTPDLDLVRMVRELLPDVPLGVSFDLHANLPPEMADLVDVASVYRTHPHVDMASTAVRVLGDLGRCVEGNLATHCVVRNEGILLPSFNMRTSDGPMQELERMARALTAGAIIEVGVCGGFPYADTRNAGASVLVVSDARGDPKGADASRVANALCRRIEALARAFAVRLPTPEEAIATALSTRASGLVAVTDPADNPLSGGACDTPGLLRALLAARVEVPCVFASIADPDAVTAARQAGVGAAVDMKLGGRYGPHFGEGVRVSATVEGLTDGVFRNTGPMATGLERRCGGSAVLVVSDQPTLRVVVTAEPVPADDPAFYALHRIDPAALRLLCVKAKNHFHAGMGRYCRAIIACDSPGPAAVNLSRLPFRNLRLARSE